MIHDLRYALRTLRHNPGFALVAIVSLALGIGASAAIFSLADFLLLRPLPVPNASEIMVVESQLHGETAGLFQQSGLSYPDFVDVQKKSHSFAGLTASQYFPFGFAHDKTVLPQMKYGALVSGNFFSVLGGRPALGRDFRPDEDEVPGRNAVVVLSHDIWETEFASSPDVIGFRRGGSRTAPVTNPARFSRVRFAKRPYLVRYASLSTLCPRPGPGGE